MKQLEIKNSEQKITIGKVVCVGRNYAAHAKEMGNEVPDFPILFLKTATCLIPSRGEVVHPDYSSNLHHEIELVLIIGNKIKNATEEVAENAIFGYAVGLDMTLRDLQNESRKRGEPWTLAKVFDTSGVISPVILKSEYHLGENEKIFLSVNGEVKQSSSLDKMLFGAVATVQHISKNMTLEKGDIIFTGTPDGVGRVMPGDKLTGGIENIGEIEAIIV